MKHIRAAGKILITLVLLLFAAGCASSLKDKQNLAVAADFKVITPSKPDQQELLQKLSANKVTRVNYGGKTYYILPDLKNNQAYVGGPKQYEAYQQLLQVQRQNVKTARAEKAADNYAAELEQANNVNWGAWGGWGGWGPLGWY